MEEVCVDPIAPSDLFPIPPACSLLVPSCPSSSSSSLSPPPPPPAVSSCLPSHDATTDVIQSSFVSPRQPSSLLLERLQHSPSSSSRESPSPVSAFLPDSFDWTLKSADTVDVSGLPHSPLPFSSHDDPFSWESLDLPDLAWSSDASTSPMMQLLASSPLVCDDFAFAMGLSPPPLSPAPSMDLALDADTQAAIEGVCDLTFLEGLQFDRSFVDPIDLVFGDAASTLQLDWLAISPTDAPKTTVDQGAHSIQDIEQLLVGAQAADADIEALLNFDLTTPERAPATSVESAWTNSWASTADVFGLPSSPYVSDCLPDIFELCQLLDVSPPSPSVAKAVIEVLVDKPVVAVQTPASSRSKDELRAATRKVHERMYEDILSTVAEPNGMFVCPVESCSKEFNRRYNLKTHFASHLTLRPFDCPACDRTFTRRADARRHLENKHPEELEQDPTRHATRRDLVRAGFPPTKSNKARPPAAKQPAKRAREEDAGVPLRASSRVKRARGKA